MAPDTLVPIGALVFQSVHDWLKNTESQLGIGCLAVQSAVRSRLNFFGDDSEDDVLVASSHHCSQCLITFYGVADVAGRGDSLTVDADDDVGLLQPSSGRE